VNDKTTPLIGYARRSPADLPLKKQISALKKAGVSEELLFTDELDASQQQTSLKKAIEKARSEGGTLVVTHISLLDITAKGVMRMMWTLREHNIALRTLQEPIEMHGPHGPHLLEMLLSLFRVEHDLVHAKMKALSDERPQETRGRRTVMTPEREKLGIEALRQGRRGDPVWRMLQKVGGDEAPNLARSTYFTWQRNKMDELGL
jgi:DNA invertase Pin-like site-specific DNA recombinase